MLEPPKSGLPPWFKSIAAAIATISSVGLVFGLALPLLSLEMERRGISGGVLGLNVATSGFASLLFAPLVPRIAARFGVCQTLMAALVASAACFLGFFYAPAFWMWFPLRLVAGMSGAALFVLSEFWISATAPPQKRGMIMGVYASFLSVGFAAGPIILSTVGSTGLAPYLTGCILMLLASIPVLIAWQESPKFTRKTKPSNFLHFLFLAPLATGAALLFGSIESSSFALLPVYGIGLEFNERTAILLASVMTIGNVALQVPLGLLSDRMDRRLLLCSCAAVGFVGAALLPLLAGAPLALMAMLFIWGGTTGALYTVGLAHLSARFTGNELASANSAFVFCYSLGAFIGPAFLGAMMDAWNPHGFALGLCILFLPYILVYLWRTQLERRA